MTTKKNPKTQQNSSKHRQTAANSGKQGRPRRPSKNKVGAAYQWALADVSAEQSRAQWLSGSVAQWLAVAYSGDAVSVPFSAAVLFKSWPVSTKQRPVISIKPI